MRATRPDYFERLANGQTPEYLWIGCADSRVPANEILGLAPGDVFVQRNVGNLAIPRDMNAMACLEYAVDVLKVKHVIVCGHYGCGAVKAALTMPATTGGFVSHWVSDIRATRDRHAAALRRLPGGPDARWQRLVELNVVHQVFNVVVAPIVQAAWARGQALAVHGLVYALADGLLQEVTHPITCVVDVDAAAADAAAAAETGDVTHALLGEAFSTHRWFQDTSTAAAEAEAVEEAGGVERVEGAARVAEEDGCCAAGACGGG
jgi:carbonic anhydrase